MIGSSFLERLQKPGADADASLRGGYQCGPCALGPRTGGGKFAMSGLADVWDMLRSQNPEYSE